MVIDLKAEGNEFFRLKFFEKSSQKYTEALRACPLEKCANLRAILYSNRAAAFAHMVH